MVKAKAFKLNLLKELGELSTKKIEKLVSVLEKEFPQRSAQPFGWVFFNPLNKKSIILTTNQITISYDGDNIPPDEDELNGILSVLIETLMLDDGANAIYNFVAHRESKLDSLKDSLNFVNFNGKQLEGLEGVAYRFILNRKDQMGDLRVEPFILDPHKVFLELELKEMEILNFSQIVERAIKAYTEFTTDMVQFSETFF